MIKISVFFATMLVYNLYLCNGFSMRKSNKTIRIDRFLGRCPGYENVPMYLQDMRLNRVGRSYYFSSKIFVMRDLARKLAVRLKLERCKSKEALDTCEPYPDSHINNICDLIKMNNQLWTSFGTNTKPELLCPFRKGTYVCTNGTFDTTAILTLPLEGWYWKTFVYLFEADDNKSKETSPVMCLYVESEIVSA